MKQNDNISKSLNSDVIDSAVDGMKEPKMIEPEEAALILDALDSAIDAKRNE